MAQCSNATARTNRKRVSNDVLDALFFCGDGGAREGNTPYGGLYATFTPLACAFYPFICIFAYNI